MKFSTINIWDYYYFIIILGEDQKFLTDLNMVDLIKIPLLFFL